MKIKVLFFAKARSLTGCSAHEFEVADGSCLHDLTTSIYTVFPELLSIGSTLLWAVNGKYSGQDQILSDLSEVACFPPVSGG
ncbi:MAG: MoaD/ThiS family protein [Planctomyces sp.]|nr:MoaD/ThiS family protein [Planctomyces sp.]